MHPLPVRNLLAITVLTVMVGLITATIVLNMQVVEGQIQVVRRVYMPLALVSKDLARREADLYACLDKVDSATPSQLCLNSAHARRNVSLEALDQAAGNLNEVAGADTTVLGSEVEQIDRDVAAIEPDYQTVATPGKPLPREDPSFDGSLQRFAAGEHNLASTTTRLASLLDDRLQSRTRRVEDNMHRLRRWTIALGLAAVVLGLVMTLWLVVRLRSRWSMIWPL
jgi:hypothetical protein